MSKDPAAADRAGHRQRLRERFLADDGGAMPDYELLELLLFGAQPRGDTKPTAKALLKRFKTFGAVISASPDELMDVEGMGEAGVVALKAVRAAAVRLSREELLERTVLSSWQQVVDYCRSQLAHEKTERFHLLFLDRKNALIADEAQSRGTVDHTPVYPREVVKRALELGASALILVHNHPSGDTTPSQADIAVTREVVAAATPLGIEVHDHIIVGREGHSSLRSLGLL